MNEREHETPDVDRDGVSRSSDHLMTTRGRFVFSRPMCALEITKRVQRALAHPPSSLVELARLRRRRRRSATTVATRSSVYAFDES